MTTLIAKLARASTVVGALATDKTNTAQNYSFISADKVLQRAGDALAQEGIVVVPSITSDGINETAYTDNYGKNKTRYDAVVIFSMLIADGESELTAPWLGRGSDYSAPEKATFKAITSGHKYFLMKLLNIGVGNEDGEHESESETQRPAQRPLNPQQQRVAETRIRMADGPPNNEGVTRPPLNREEDGQVLRAGKLPAKVTPDDELTDENFGMRDNPRTDLTKFAGLVHNPDITIPKGAMACITHLRQKHKASDEPMSAEAYGTLVGYTDKVVGDKQPVHGMVLSAICGTEIDRNNHPGSQVSEMIDWLADPNTFVNKVAILKQILGLCRQIEREDAE